MKVDLDALRTAQKIAKETGGVFCQDCGETEPECGFYPMWIFTNTSLSEYLCLDCEKRRRGE